VRRALQVRRRQGELLAAITGGLLIVATLAVVGTSAQAATRSPHTTASACGAQVQVPGHVGRIGGITRAVPTRSGCVHITGDPAGGTPPLLFHGGPVMDTSQTGALVIRPIFWAPRGHPIDANYRSIINQYLGDVAAASGQHTNVYSTATEYFGTNGGNIRYKVKVRSAINDTHALPASGCTLEAVDTANVYADSSGYNACLDDDQIIAETDRLVTNRNLRRDYAHIYVMFLPKHVEACFAPGLTSNAKNACTINYEPSAAFCAYHSQAPDGLEYANMPFPIYFSGAGFTCGSNARIAFPGVIQSPNNNPDGDTEISPTSHEINELITNPDNNGATASGWFDVAGFENGDECAFTYGPVQGPSGQAFNQVINGNHYITQEEFSNSSFFASGGGCLQHP
jgi:hypothetical protein